MAKIRDGKCDCWILPMGVLLSLFAVITAQQPGFLSISCGGTENHTNSENNITWVTDADYIDVGETADIGNASKVGSYLHTLRFFPKPLNKSCYQLPVAPDVTFLLRLWFAVGSYSGFQTFPSFQLSIETLGMLNWDNINITYRDASSYEYISVSSGRVLYVCLIRTSERDDPFISAIEMRTFQDGMYGQAKPGTILSPKFYNIGGNSLARYPQDKFDRIWDYYDSPLNIVLSVSTEEVISTNNTRELPPTAVMQTAWVANNSNIIQLSVDSSEGDKTLLLLYFAEIETLNMSESRSFYIQINGGTPSKTINLLQNYSAVELTLLPNEIDYFDVVKAPNSSRPPILNAYEYHRLYATDEATYSQDIDALHAIKRSFNIKGWVSDPCYLLQWDGIGCDRSSSPIRISEIDLSGRNLTGSVPNDIGNLTALVNVYLQNNNLSGTVPDWLSELKNLQELNIENNNFSGLIPAQLLLNCSLKFNYSGNPNLRMDKRECTLKNSNNNKLKVVLGVTLSGFLIIALIVVIVLYRKKTMRSKNERVAIKSSGMEMEPRSFFHQDNSRIMVPNPTKSRAFTLDEMVAATQTFSREIGRGGFGSVFYGKLPEGKDIAVKVLSLFSHQGVEEFLNEVDVLSRINHKNLVSLIGYCNETREVMLIYEHMSGGSLRGHLYGTSAEQSQLNWKRRLKITLDAAQGLEYLHVGSNPKIIHRDVKTANILLDSNMNGKLADFGLSRMTIDAEATHVTTAVKGTAGYLDPEYYCTQMLTEKSDVYSFGVVLLEIICGRAPIDLKLPETEVNIIRWVTPYLMEIDENAGKITEIIDKRLGGSYNMKSIIGVIKVAMRCVQSEPSCRPGMSEVVAELKEAIKEEDIASISILEENGMDLLAAPAIYSSLDWSEPKEIEWGDNSSNISKVGR